jgi:hypothetical protein
MTLRDDCIERLAELIYLQDTGRADNESWADLAPDVLKVAYRGDAAPLVDAVLETVAERCEERLAESDKWLGVLPKNEIIRLQREAIEATLKSLASECREGTE